MVVRIALIAVFIAGSVSAQSSKVENGQDLYLYFCAECHGKDAASVGPMAEMLAIEPPDLTDLTDRNQGVFPITDVAKQIDGRIPIGFHTYMPVFGPSLDHEQYVSLALPSGQTLMVPQPLADLLTYLQSIQTQGN